jgi:hypothetical protein
MGKLVKLEELEAGMTLDKDVENLQGAVLLRKGNQITERHLTIFKTWGVASVFIKEELSAADLDGKTPSEVAQSEILEAEKTINDKFAPYAEDQIMQGIREQAVKYKTAQIKAKYNV